MKESITTSKRVGIVEIGSRAVRLLVVDVSRDRGLTFIATDWKETQLMAAVRSGDHVLRERVSKIASIVDDFLKTCRALSVSDIKVFGTKAMRAMPSKYVQDICIRIPGLEILDGKTEAFYSLVAAIRGLPPAVSVRSAVLVIDQGAGSTELILGRLSDDKVKLTQYKSYNLGTQVLVELLKENKSNIHRFRDMLEKKIDQYRLIRIAPMSPTVVMGSSATKLAWIKVNRGRRGQYSPSKVHGQILGTRSVDNLVEAAINNPDQVNQIIEPNNAHDNEFETVLVGVVALSILLHKLRRTEFVVSGWGTRYGVAWTLGGS